MKVTCQPEIVVKPTTTYVITLSEREAQLLTGMIGQLEGGDAATKFNNSLIKKDFNFKKSDMNESSRFTYALYTELEREVIKNIS